MKYTDLDEVLNLESIAEALKDLHGTVVALKLVLCNPDLQVLT